MEAWDELTSGFTVTYSAFSKLPSPIPPVVVPVAVHIALSVALRVVQTVAV